MYMRVILRICHIKSLYLSHKLNAIDGLTWAGGNKLDRYPPNLISASRWRLSIDTTGSTLDTTLIPLLSWFVSRRGFHSLSLSTYGAYFTPPSLCVVCSIKSRIFAHLCALPVSELRLLAPHGMSLILSSSLLLHWSIFSLPEITSTPTWTIICYFMDGIFKAFIFIRECGHKNWVKS